MNCVVFDMDGVIFDSERLVLSVWQYLAGMYGLKDIERTFIKCIGTNLMQTKEIMLEAYGSDFDFDKFRGESSVIFHERIDRDGIPVKPGARELLSYLKINGYRIALASSSRKESVMSELKSAKLDGFFEVIVTGDMVKKSKPEPDIFLEACKQMGVEPARTFAIEDSYNGVRSAYRAGMNVFMVPDLLPPTDEMRDIAYRIYPDLIALRTDYFSQTIK